MRRLIPWGLAAALLAACQATQPAAPPTPPATPPQVPAPHDQTPTPRGVLAPILFLSGPDAMEAGKTTMLVGRAMLPAGSYVEGLDVQSMTPSPSPTPRSPFGGGFGGGFGSSATFTYALKVAAGVTEPDAPLQPHDFSLPFTPPTAGTYHLQLDPRRYSVLVSPARRTSGGGFGQPSPSPSPMPEMWGVVTPTALSADEALLGNPNLVERKITSIAAPTSARVGQRVQMTARFWTNGLGKTAVDAYVEGNQIRVTGLAMPDSRAVMGPIPQQVEVPFSVLLTERRLYTVVSGKGEGGYATINVQ